MSDTSNPPAKYVCPCGGYCGSPINPPKSTSTNPLREKYPCLECSGHEDGTNCLEELLTAKTTEVLQKIKTEMAMHTVPEGTGLITRHYLNNTIDFEIAQLQQPGKDHLTGTSEVKG